MKHSFLKDWFIISFTIAICAGAVLGTIYSVTWAFSTHPIIAGVALFMAVTGAVAATGREK